MTETSARFLLPFIIPGQAQKELFHNESLAVLDAALHACVEEGPIDVPPEAPELGQSWIVGAGAVDAWTGKDDALGCWTSGGWRFIEPVPGMTAWNRALGCWLYWSEAGWSDGRLPATAFAIAGQQVVGPRLETIASPSGGTIIDAEARAAIDSVIATLKSHGLIDS